MYSAYLFFIHEEQKASRERIEKIRTVYLPAVEIASNNVLLFDGIAANFKDAVLAGEVEWVRNTQKERTRIEDHLTDLGRYAPAVAATEVARVRSSFMHYYENAHALSMAMLNGGAGAEESNRLIENNERYHAQAAADFTGLKADLLDRLSQGIDETNTRLQRQVLIAAILGVALIVVIVGVTVVLSLSTRKSLREMNQALRNMAQDTPDFSRRLTRESNDELGEMVGWFNLLADKFETNYRQIELLSITDKLTQLYNRAKIDELFLLELGKARRYGSMFTAILMDLDHFKRVNDLHGHQTGDRVLRDLAEMLRHNVRSTDHLGRWGGEEFIVLLPNTDLQQGRQLAEKLREAIAAFAFAEVGQQTGSFGVATYCTEDDADSMTRRADACLYLAKHQGRNRVIDEMELPDTASTVAA